MKTTKTFDSITLGVTILSFIFFVVLMNTVLLILGFSLQSWVGYASPLISLCLMGFILRNRPWRQVVTLITVFITIVSLALFVSSKLTDYSWDGNAYHKVAIGALANGWNPLKENVETFNASERNPFPVNGIGFSKKITTPWVDHYPKASWVFSATFYKVTNNIETGKSFSFLIIASLFLISYGFFANSVKRKMSIALSGILAFNPITVSQLYSNYVDGSMGNLLILLILGLTMVIDTKKRKRDESFVVYGIILCSATLAINLKFTGLAHVGIIYICYCLFSLANRDIRRLLRLSVVGILTLIIGVGILGSTSYIKNMTTKGSPLYPLIGKGSVNFISAEEPVGYEDDTKLKKFIKANLSPTIQTNHALSAQNGPPGFKYPFSISPDEVSALRFVDVRQGGYGVWFGGVLIVSLFGSFYFLFRSLIDGRKYYYHFILPVVPIIIAILALDATWWARYVPHLIIFPVVTVLAALCLNKKVYANIIIFCLLFNVLLTACISLDSQVNSQRKFDVSLKANFRCNSSRASTIYSTSPLEGFFYNLKDRCTNIRTTNPVESIRNDGILLSENIYLLAR